MQKPSIPKGTRDFLPQETAKRNYIFNTISDVFKLFGFEQIETPAMENLSTLLGKYGDEGDKLLFKILNSGDYLSEVSDENLHSRNLQRLTGKISEKGLRYDLTVPFARFVAQHRNEISFPFKRYQIQPVWRADRPQKGRYREFFQCDADVVGSDSLLNEVELVQIIDEVYRRFGINVCIKINNRKILNGIAEVIGESDKIIDITVAIDKLDKIGLEKVNEELAFKGISREAVELLQPIILLEGANKEKIATLRHILSKSEIGQKGIDELEFILNKTELLPVRSTVELDLTLARGLNYYTGAIFEVKASDVEMGSISGGGRYDNLTGGFGLPDVSGVGISFGADRIFDVLNQLNLYPKELLSSTMVMVANFGEKEIEYCLPFVSKLRQSGISTELYPEAAKMKKQMAYADSKKIPFVIIAGENEMADHKVTLKNMTTGEQLSIHPEEIVEKIQR
ncbi:MAG: histidine--tRNA ligase [Candidatus Azobacteroides sp.]|nr:histidine--tRNA ligase [Candidatus Azobacteroides sp.]